MLALLHPLLLLADDAAAAAPAQGSSDPNGISRLLFIVIGFGAMFYFLMLRPQKKKEDEFRSMIDGLKESDHVVTVGGIHGVVTNVQRDAERVTIRVDESTGTKLRVSTSAIARVVTGDDSESSSTSTKSK